MSKQKHLIEAAWFTDHIAVHELASGTGIGQNKRLIVVVQVPTTQAAYQVIAWGVPTYDGPDFAEAVRVYNEEGE